MDAGLSVYESEAREVQQAKPDLGPVCYDCAKPVKVRPEKGGCACAPRPIRESQVTQATTTADRQVMALERIGQLLEAFAKHQKIELPDAIRPITIAEATVPQTGTPVDAIRAQVKGKVG